MTAQFICTGHAPEPGCGRILTDNEREYYRTSCEDCERKWASRIAAWRRADADDELSQMFAARGEKWN